MNFEEAELLRHRAEAFLRNTERLYVEGEYDLAAFCIEQYCQLMLKYKLLVKLEPTPARIPRSGWPESFPKPQRRPGGCLKTW